MSERTATHFVGDDCPGGHVDSFPERYSDAWVILRVLHSPNAPFTTGQLHDTLAGEMTGERLVEGLAALVQSGRVESETVGHGDRLGWALTAAGKAEWRARWT